MSSPIASYAHTSCHHGTGCTANTAASATKWGTMCERKKCGMRAPGAAPPGVRGSRSRRG